MKILTRDGLDVTDAASRGSKTKEQRNHAHLMRIKACDSCRRKKIRCDPSHRGRGGATPRPPPQPAGSRRAARSKKPPPPQPPPSRSPSRPSETVGDAFPAAPFALDLSSSHFDPLDALDPVAAALAGGPWDDSTQFPPVDAIQDYGFSLGPDYYYLGSQSCTSSSALSFQASTPQSARERGPPPGVDTAILQPASQTASSSHLFLDPPASSFDYTDFDLFSPESIFLEDDRMLSLGSSSSSAGPVSSEYGQAAFDDWSTDSTLCRTTGDAADGYRGPSVAGSSDRHVFPPGASSTSPDPLGGQVFICCPPGTMVLTAGGHDGHALDHASTSFNGSGSAAAAAYSSGTPVEYASRGSADDQAIGAAAELHTESPARVSARGGVAATPSSVPGHAASPAAHEDAAGVHLASDDPGTRVIQERVVEPDWRHDLDVGREQVTQGPPRLLAPPGVNSSRPVGGAVDSSTGPTTAEAVTADTQRRSQRSQLPHSLPQTSLGATAIDGLNCVPPSAPLQSLVRGVASPMPRAASPPKSLTATSTDHQVVAAQEAHPTPRQMLPLAQRDALAFPAEVPIAVSVVLLATSLMPALPWAHVAIAVLALVVRWASAPAPKPGKPRPSAAEGKTPQKRPWTLTRRDRALASLRNVKSGVALREGPWRAFPAATLLRG